MGINRTAESQSDYKDNQWFQNGFNKSYNLNSYILLRLKPGSHSWDKHKHKPEVWLRDLHGANWLAGEDGFHPPHWPSCGQESFPYKEVLFK